MIRISLYKLYRSALWAGEDLEGVAASEQVNTLRGEKGDGVPDTNSVSLV